MSIIKILLGRSMSKDKLESKNGVSVSLCQTIIEKQNSFKET